MIITPVQIRKRPIRLGQFLKYANMVEDGIQAKLVIQSGKVFVNDRVETRRGKQLNHNDTVRYEKSIYQVRYQEDQENP